MTAVFVMRVRRIFEEIFNSRTIEPKQLRRGESCITKLLHGNGACPLSTHTSMLDTQSLCNFREPEMRRVYDILRDNAVE